jgi:hypothetical protein
MGALLLGCVGSSHAGDDGSNDGSKAASDPGPYLSAQLGGGRIDGGNASGNRWMRSRAGEYRFGRPQATGARLDVVYYNEGHPDNNHRDGFALQEVVSARTAGGRVGAEFGIGPYLSMNTTFIDGRQLDDTRWGLLLSATLRIALWDAPDAAHLRIGFNHAAMREVHRSNALMVGIGRQFGTAVPEPDTVPGIGATWFGVSGGAAVTSMPGTGTGRITVFEASRDLNRGPAHWAGSARLLFEGSDGVRVDRRGLAGQLWYVQQVTPRLSMSAGIGPYVARNRRDDNQTRANLLVSLEAERALSGRTRVFFSFDRVKTFLRRDDRDLFLAGVRKRF